MGAQHPSGESAVVMDVQFPDTYPMSPPFIRVVRPRFQMHTGHITIGGSVCMQLLTPSGWLPSVSLENVFVSIRSEMIEGGGHIDMENSGRDYSMGEDALGLRLRHWRCFEHSSESPRPLALSVQ